MWNARLSRALVGLCALGAGAYACATGGGSGSDETMDDDGASGGGTCEEPFDTLEHCGACDTPCMPLHVTEALCNTGTCDYDACIVPYLDCDGIRSNGCTTDPASDPENCGSCGTNCATIAENVQSVLCTAGACDYDSCAMAFADCDAIRKNGCETSANSLTDCGDCDTPCAPAHASGATCATGACEYGSCNADYQDCDTIEANGCESHRLSDPLHCGDCVTDCGADSCVNGGCSALGYSATFTASVTPSTQCTDWNAFKPTIPNVGLGVVNLSGTFDAVGITCADPATVQGLGDAIRLDLNFHTACNGHVWSYCASRDELWIDAPTNCDLNNCPSPGYILRPCQGNENWGGIGTMTCTPPTQTMTLAF